jgi:16S rRNA (uracil1498-N3)-methyltransferase
VPARAPERELRAATALVFVDDLDAPELTGEDAHHLAAVLRLRAGETVAAADGAGGWRLCEWPGPTRSGRGRRRDGSVPAPDSGEARLEPTGEIHRKERARPSLEVGFSFAKAERNEWAVAKLVELGIDRLSLLVSERTVVRPDRGGAAHRLARLQRIVREAAMQSRRPYLPEVREPVGFGDVVDRAVAEAGADAVALAEPGGSPLSLASTVVLVGPEGGWAPDELRRVERHVSVGDGVLRIETAAVACGAILAALRAGAIREPESRSPRSPGPPVPRSLA